MTKRNMSHLKEIYKIFHFCYSIPAILYLLSFAGCATRGYIYPPRESKKISGIYHRVKQKQTLWRISKAYGVELEEIVRINRIPEAAKIDTGQLIFIPGAKKPLEIEQIYHQKNREGFIWPVGGKIISFFGSKKHNIINKGIDIQVEKETDVLATRTGKVCFYNDDLKGYGKTIILDHGDGFSSLYARNLQVLVKVGDTVTRGESIAKIGPLGKNIPSYLHFEIRKSHKAQNPLHYLP